MKSGVGRHHILREDISPVIVSHLHNYPVRWLYNPRFQLSLRKSSNLLRVTQPVSGILSSNPGVFHRTVPVLFSILGWTLSCDDETELTFCLLALLPLDMPVLYIFWNSPEHYFFLTGIGTLLWILTNSKGVLLSFVCLNCEVREKLHIRKRRRSVYVYAHIMW